MAEYAGFYHNTTTQKPKAKVKPQPSLHTTDETLATLTKTASSITTHHNSSYTTKSSTSPSRKSSRTAGAPQQMLGTPLLDYKHAANQTSKTRAVQQQQANARKLSTASGAHAADSSHQHRKSSKNALHTTESRTSAGSLGTAITSTTTVRDGTKRSSSISSTTGSSGFAAHSWTEHSAHSHDELMARPFVRLSGRRYLRDISLPYPLPCDLQELHRQILRTMLLCQVFNGPVCSPHFQTKPPKRVLEVGCGTGFWSVMCHRHFLQRGFSSISFTGVDIAPLAPKTYADDDMNWRFVQHDLRRTPLPFRDEEFNLIMIKDLSMVTPTTDMRQQQQLMDEYLRILKPGGTLEIWDGDHSLRMLLPHAPPAPKDDDESEDEEQVHTNAMGTYTLTTQTPLAAPQNTYLNDYNTWINKALEKTQAIAYAMHGHASHAAPRIRTFNRN